MAQQRKQEKPAAKPGSAIERQKPVGLTTIQAVPDYLKGQIGNQAGFEQAEKDDFVLPRLTISQALSPELDRSHAKYIDDLEQGMFFNTVTGEIYGEEIEVIALFFTKQRIKFKKPIGSGIDCQSLNGKTGGRYSPQSCRACEYAQFQQTPDSNGSTAPPCTEFKNLVVLVVDQKKKEVKGPLVFSNKSTGLSMLKQWNSQMKMTNLPMYAGIYKLTVTDMVKNTNRFKSWNFRRVGFVPEDIYQRAETFFASLHDKDISFNVDDMEHEESASPTEM